ncbi:hypothetical protein GCM10022207_00790 [Streptomyces lannensis]|uniref:Secreted protein n=1 Tax=Streptomyces lannensis TaxID=766498 RepID=A0ABP7JH03_9ACTN
MRGQVRGRADHGLCARTVTVVALAWSAAAPGDSPKGLLRTWRRSSPALAQMARGQRQKPATRPLAWRTARPDLRNNAFGCALPRASRLRKTPTWGGGRRPEPRSG